MYHLFIATPEKVVYDAQITSLIAPGGDGYLEILTNHVPIVTTLKSGKLTIIDENNKKWIWAISEGYLEFSNNKAAILADSLELPSDIDVKRAEESLKRARKRLSSVKDNKEIEVKRAQEAAQRAENRIKVAKEFKS